jgi:Cof subfamily protein (haloacid dehalogenase superfamily)
MAIKAIFLDIDGTLTNREKKITRNTMWALTQAQRQGIRLVLASGRPAKGLFQYGDQLEMRIHHGLFVCYNGARVVDCSNGEVLVDITIPLDLSRAVLEHLKQFEVRPIITYGDYMVVHNVYDCMIHDGSRAFNVIEYESRMNNYLLMEVRDLSSFASFPVNKILTAADSTYLKAHFREMAAPFQGKLSMMFTAPFYYEYTADGINKGNALQSAMASIGIAPEECIAFGDAENDISMLKYAGIGVAMGNAAPEVKAAADEITMDNDHDGIALSLAKHIPTLGLFG